MRARGLSAPASALRRMCVLCLQRAATDAGAPVETRERGMCVCMCKCMWYEGMPDDEEMAIYVCV